MSFEDLAIDKRLTNTLFSICSVSSVRHSQSRIPKRVVADATFARQCWAYQFAQMQNYAINNNLTPFISCVCEFC